MKKLKSIYYSLFLKGTRNVFGLRFYGNINLSIAKSAKITCEEGNLYFNKPMRSPEPFPGMLEMYPGSEIKLNKNFIFYSGAHIIIANDASLKLGSGYVNRNCKIKCFESIEIGEDVAISENVTIWDSDVHQINNNTAKTKPIKIGNHVWIGTNSIILKGVIIGDGAVIAAGSVVNRNIPSRCLAAGTPARVVKENIDWD